MDGHGESEWASRGRVKRIKGVLKVVVWGGNGKRAGENDEVEYVTEYVTPLRSAPQFISLATSQVDPTETATYGLSLSLDRFFFSSRPPSSSSRTSWDFKER